jgi:hypothetical protein
MSSEKEILSLEDKRIAALLAKDWKALEDMLHDQLLYTHSSGITDTKGSWLDSIKSGKVKYNGRAQIEADIGGQPRTLKLLFLNAWTRTPQGWKFVAWQSCPQPT